MSRPPETCPHCGADVPPRAKACPECGSDEHSGWSERARYDSLDLPDENFQYDEFIQDEFGKGRQRPRLKSLWWLLALALLVLLLLPFLKTFLR